MQFSVTMEKLDESTFVMASGGGRAQLKVWTLSLDENGKLVVAEKSSHLLRGDDKRRKKTWRENKVIYDTETRYTDLCLTKEGKTWSVLVGCSDGALRKFWLDASFKVAKINEESLDNPHCFLKAISEKGQVLTSSNDGFVRSWSAENVALRKAGRIHKSGINAISRRMNDGQFFTAGDDGTISVVEETLDEFKLVNSFPRSHSAQITGLHLQMVGDVNYLLSCSVDQRISAWQIVKTEGAMKISQNGQVCTDVADIQCMAVWNDGDDSVLAVGGEGMAIFKLRHC